MKILKYIFLFLFPILQLFSHGGSIYSRFGIGNIYYDNSARKLGIGGTAVSVYDIQSINNYNPAGWFNIRETRFETGLSLNGLSVSDNKSDAFYLNTKFQGIYAAFPVDRDLGIVISGGLVPYSTVNYEVKNEITNDLIEGSYNSIFSGDGGLSKFYIGSSYLTPIGIAIGATYEYYVGKINGFSSVEFGSNSDYKNFEFQSSKYFRGKGFSFGLISMNLANLLGISSFNEIRVGANYNYMGELKTDTSEFSISTLGQFTISEGKYNTKIPYRLGLGFNVRYDENYLFIFDYMFQPWSKYESNGIKDPHYKDLQRFSFGVEYQNMFKRMPTFWEQIAIRGGMVFEETQYRINEQDLSMLAFQLGFSFPIGTLNTLDIGFQYGIRGTTDSDLVKEKIFQATITLSFGELWFMRQNR